MDKFRIRKDLPCILKHKFSKAPDDPGKWQLEVVAVRDSSLRLRYFPVRKKEYILGQGTKEEMEALWISVHEEICTARLKKS